MLTSNTPQSADEAVERLTNPDPFRLPRRVKQRIRCCSHAGCGEEHEIRYLWIDLSQHCLPNRDRAPLSLEEWLGVIDEAASLGATWVVFTFEDSPAEFPDIWQISRWAQDNYGMVTGFHSRSGRLSPADCEALCQLEAEKCQVFVAREHLPELESLQQRGVQVMPALPETHDRHSMCEMPSSMIFVDPAGTLYTCGMVKENQDYALGHILDRKLTHVLRDPTLPHAVPEQAVHDAHGCEGCPPLVARDGHCH